MHDTFLLKRISENMDELCKENKIGRVNKLRIITNPGSHINKDNLYEHLLGQDNGLIGEWTSITVDRREMEELTAVIDTIEGDTD